MHHADHTPALGSSRAGTNENIGVYQCLTGEERVPAFMFHAESHHTPNLASCPPDWALES